MLQLIGCTEKERWNRTVRSFPDWDVYYLCEYVLPLRRHGDGEPLLVYYEADGVRLCYAVMQQDIADAAAFAGTLPRGMYFDWETPYGYGGPLVQGEWDEARQRAFMAALCALAAGQGVVMQFLRFHPLLGNQASLARVCEVQTRKDTIVMDLADEARIMQNMDAKNRNMVRKAQRAGVNVIVDDGRYLEAFVQMYETVMDKHETSAYYYFGRPYFEGLLRGLPDNARLFVALMETRAVAAAIFLFNERYMHYHFSGSLEAYRPFAPGNLLLYEAARWGCARGIGYLHLGGGNASAEDSLMGFKKQFNRFGRLPFYIGRTVFDASAYAQLLALRKRLDPNFDGNNDFMMQYRR